MHSPVYLTGSTGSRCLAPCWQVAPAPQPPAVNRLMLIPPPCSSAPFPVQSRTLWTCQPGRPGSWLARPLLAPPRLQPPQAVGGRPRSGRDGPDSSAAARASPSKSRPPRQRKTDADSESPSDAPRRERRPPTRNKKPPPPPQRSRPPPPPPPAASDGAAGGGPPVQVDQELELECVRLALEGKGVCLLPPTGFVVLVERALPGEVLRARVVSVKRGYAEARKLSTLSPHRNAVPAPCPYFGPCGGCTLQSLQYEAQLAEKRNQVEQTLRRVGRLGPALDSVAADAAAATVGDGGGSGGSGGVAAVVGCADTLAYRNKMMFHFSSTCFKKPDMEESDRPSLGLLKPGTQHVVLPVVRAEPSGCLLQGPLANQLALRAEEMCWDMGLLPHNHASGTGQLKHLIVRSGSGMRGPAAAAATGGSSKEGAQEYMLVFGITRESAVQQLEVVAQELGREFPQLASVAAQYVRPENAPKKVARDLGAEASGAAPQQRQGGGRGRGDRRAGGRSQREAEPDSSTADGAAEEDSGSSSSSPMVLLYGKPYIHDVLCGLTFRISPGSFFQTNTSQTEVLYEIVRQAAGLRPGAVDTLLDLYCGTGTIGLSLAKECKSVIGVDIVESAVEDARLNAALNGITNATFLCANVDALDPARLLAVAAAQSPSDTEAVADSGASEARLQPDVVIVDPARAGLSLGAAAFLSRCGARRVVYVSCNMATQARDLDRLVNGPGAPFRLVSVQPVDMFPHTDHVETVAVLERRDGGDGTAAVTAG